MEMKPDFIAWNKLIDYSLNLFKRMDEALEKFITDKGLDKYKYLTIYETRDSLLPYYADFDRSFVEGVEGFSYIVNVEGMPSLPPDAYYLFVYSNDERSGLNVNPLFRE